MIRQDITIKVECPKCLGEGYHYDAREDQMVECKLCEGLGLVSERKADLYDPIADELSNYDFDEEDKKE